ncbi:hypothetical protein O2N63_16335 [Aliiroseovarius sp. KMU-50]|uniref:DUF202 domain-containing protein n=1 Tax=Aliiroseovarius salicola TaxID=3009082 RepID=A0ABT4W5A4_9RHOB|nr:hypothetical protein [Aliiroseovarius sp. KMU-50]MDA5095660.1 hypothetical protein [Aliiroseovarius sp. KMU-50]
MFGDESEGIEQLNEERETLRLMQTHMQGFLRKRLMMWAIRWCIGMPIAFAIPAIWGVWRWLPMAAGVVALISLATILIMGVAMNRKFRRTHLSADQLEHHSRDEIEKR